MPVLTTNKEKLTFENIRSPWFTSKLKYDLYSWLEFWVFLPFSRRVSMRTIHLLLCEGFKCSGTIWCGHPRRDSLEEASKPHIEDSPRGSFSLRPASPTEVVFNFTTFQLPSRVLTSTNFNHDFTYPTRIGKQNLIKEKQLKLQIKDLFLPIDHKIF